MATAIAHMGLTRGCPISFGGDEISKLFLQSCRISKEVPQSKGVSCLTK